MLIILSIVIIIYALSVQKIPGEGSIVKKAKNRQVKILKQTEEDKMIEIAYNWDLKQNGILHIKKLSIGYKQGNTPFGQSDLISIIEEEINPDTGSILFATLHFTSGKWYRQIKYLLEELKKKMKEKFI